MSQPRTLVVAGEGSRVTVMESYVGGASDPHLVNALTQVCVLKGARVCHYKHQQEGNSLGVRPSFCVRASVGL